MGMTFRLNPKVILLASLSAATALNAQNPSWNGREFRQVFTDGDTAPGIAEGVLVQDAVLTRNGIILYSPVQRGRGDLSAGGGVFLLENQTLHVLANLQTPGLENFRAATHAGLLDDETVTFVLERSDGSFPLARWSGSLQLDET